MCFWIFDTKQVKIDKKTNVKTFKVKKNKQTQFSTHVGTIIESTQPIKITKHWKN